MGAFLPGGHPVSLFMSWVRAGVMKLGRLRCGLLTATIIGLGLGAMLVRSCCRCGNVQVGRPENCLGDVTISFCPMELRCFARC